VLFLLLVQTDSLLSVCVSMWYYTGVLVTIEHGLFLGSLMCGVPLFLGLVL
jgi:hypothetical protein